MSREIPLTQGLVAIVDDEDFKRLIRNRWFAGRKRRQTYAVRQIYLAESKTNRRLYMHREVLGARPGSQVDHANGNGLDNRRSNLRYANYSQQKANSMLSSSNTSGFKGVSRDGRGRRKEWRAQLRVGGRSLLCGSFHEATEAARAYDEAAVTHFGEFARTNLSMGLLG